MTKQAPAPPMTMMTKQPPGFHPPPPIHTIPESAAREALANRLHILKLPTLDSADSPVSFSMAEEGLTPATRKYRATADFQGSDRLGVPGASVTADPRDWREAAEAAACALVVQGIDEWAVEQGGWGALSASGRADCSAAQQC